MADLLVVDDDCDFADLFCEVLRGQGHEVRVARNGNEGISLLRARQPDLLFLDLDMPMLGGAGVAHAMLCHDAGEEKIPIILLSGAANLLAVAAHIGTPYFLKKPAAPGELLALLARALFERVGLGSASAE